uniref:Gag-Pol polyprotein n=1 Tax=Tanacetum cinerariifolium TaxID=118510 RepID=A0A699K9V6_TANCI|nr:hypothetical protein [Tanacetum cinerariifolium]
MENYKNVSQDIRDQLNAEAEAVQIIRTGIDNDIYSTVDACPNACELNQCDVTNHQVNVQFLLQLQPEWQRFVTLVKQSQELKTVSYHKLYDILKQHQNEVNKIKAKRLARTANPLVLVAQQQPAYHPQNHTNHYTYNSSTRSQQAARNRGKAIVNSSAPIYDQEPATVTEDDEMSKKKEIDKLMDLISLSFTKIYKPTNNNLRTSSNTSRANQDNSPRINRGTEQADWRDDTDDESDDQELEAHYMYMAQIQEVTPDTTNSSGPIFNVEPLQKVQNDDDNYNVFDVDQEYPEQPESVNEPYVDICFDRDQDDQVDTDELAQERDLLASLIDNLKCKIDDSKNRNKFLESSNQALVDKLKANNDLSKTNQLMFNDLKKFQAELDKYHDVNYASKVSNDENYNVFAIESKHPEQSKSVHDTYPIEQDEHNVIINLMDMSYDREQIDKDDDNDDDLANEHELLASLIEKLKCKIDDNKNRNKFLETSNKVLVDKMKGQIKDFKNKTKCLESSNNHFKESNNELSKINELMYKHLKKIQAKLDRHNDVKYASKIELIVPNLKEIKCHTKWNLKSHLINILKR